VHARWIERKKAGSGAWYEFGTLDEWRWQGVDREGRIEIGKGRREDTADAAISAQRRWKGKELLSRCIGCR
jgi:hypothetical protein